MTKYSEKTFILWKYITELTQFAVDNSDTRWLKRNTFSIMEPDSVLAEKLKSYTRRQYKLKLAAHELSAITVAHSTYGEFRVRVKHPGFETLSRYRWQNRTNNSRNGNNTNVSPINREYNELMELIRVPAPNMRGQYGGDHMVFSVNCNDYANEYGNGHYRSPRGTLNRIWVFPEHVSHPTIVAAVDNVLTRYRAFVAKLQEIDELAIRTVNPNNVTMHTNICEDEEEFISKHFTLTIIDDITEIFTERQGVCNV